MDVTITATPAAFTRGADVLLHSIERGDWDEETCDEIAPAISAFRLAADKAGADQPVSATVEADLAAEVLGILICDVQADTELAPLVAAIDTGFRTTPAAGQ